MTEHSRDIRRRGEEHLRDRVSSELPHHLRSSAEVASPIAVGLPQGGLSHWCVPVRALGRTVATMDLDLDGHLLRYGTRGLVEPDARTETSGTDVIELTPEDVISLARKWAGSEARVTDEPRLVADGSPTRTAWMVRLELPSGAAKYAFVTPRFTWGRDTATREREVGSE